MTAGIPLNPEVARRSVWRPIIDTLRQQTGLTTQSPAPPENLLIRRINFSASSVPTYGGYSICQRADFETIEAWVGLCSYLKEWDSPDADPPIINDGLYDIEIVLFAPEPEPVPEIIVHLDESDRLQGLRISVKNPDWPSQRVFVSGFKSLMDISPRFEPFCALMNPQALNAEEQVRSIVGYFFAEL